ncbi:TfuA-like protein [Streptomyces sp. NPDC006207]
MDGTFHSTLSVGHTEILGALRKGWEIWGLSSMGAIRAAEMHHLGMRGFGDVFDRYVADPDFSDDEVTMLHSPTEPYVSFSEPMIHIRQFVDHLAHREIISVNDADEAKSFFKNRWYGDRSLGRLRQYLIREQALPVSLLDEEMGAFERFRVKTIDLARFMEVCPWKSRPNATTQG